MEYRQSKKNRNLKHICIRFHRKDYVISSEEVYTVYMCTKSNVITICKHIVHIK